MSTKQEANEQKSQLHSKTQQNYTAVFPLLDSDDLKGCFALEGRTTVWTLSCELWVITGGFWTGEWHDQVLCFIKGVHSGGIVGAAVESGGQEAMAVVEGRDNQSLDEGSGNGEEEGERVQRST